MLFIFIRNKMENANQEYTYNIFLCALQTFEPIEYTLSKGIPHSSENQPNIFGINSKL